MLDFGIDNVRGGQYDELFFTKERHLQLKKKIGSRFDKCFNCLGNHRIRKCEKPIEIDEELNEMVQEILEGDSSGRILAKKLSQLTFRGWKDRSKRSGRRWAACSANADGTWWWIRAGRVRKLLHHLYSRRLLCSWILHVHLSGSHKIWRQKFEGFFQNWALKICNFYV